MEKEQRNRLQKATQDARKLLEEEFSSQLLQTYDIDVEKVRWAEESGAHLQAEQRLIREKLIAWIEHKEAQINDRKEALLLALREMAFTALNRFVALKLMEARELVRPCVSGGLESAGFLEFTAVAQGLLVDQEGSYRLYLETIFEDVSRELRALFDPRDPASLLWPKRAALLELLHILNRPELAELWSEDETLGWVYQYFNGDAERKKMREESAAPRNSRELAVRNQFFTPRYVVEFLTDNTLGRIWYEMRQGDTCLKERCRYLVRRPNEIWLQPGEEPPAEVVADEALSQEALLRQPVQIPYRPLKDPREIRMLDPACGSMHFGLYAFDLYLEIYAEAWEFAQSSDEQAKRTEAFTPFVEYAAGFATKAAFLSEVPKLILQHNIHGIDIDPRATQIARLTLWLRTQRAWQEQRLEVGDRPSITRSNVVCAEPMPGERELLGDFVDQQFPEAERGLVQQLLETIFDKMRLAGQAGSLLKIEDDIRDTINQARREWQKLAVQQRDLFSGTELAALGQVGSSLATDLQNLTKDFWVDIEERIYAALADYANQAENGGYECRLFAEDAAQGFAFIDVCRQRHDAVVMNPPFGEPAETTRYSLKQLYPSSADNLAVSFMSRGVSLLLETGMAGSITDCSWAKKHDYRDFRGEVLASAGLHSLVHLGWEVLDGANVETNLTVRGAQRRLAFALNVSQESEKEAALRQAITSSKPDSVRRYLRFSKLPNLVFAFEMRDEEFTSYAENDFVSESFMHAVAGVKSCNSAADFRLWWEVPQIQLGVGQDWQLLHNGSPYCPFHYPAFFAVRTDGGTWKQLMSNGGARPGEAFYPKAGISFGKRTDVMYGYIKPGDQVFSQEGQAIFPKLGVSHWGALALSNSSVFACHANYVAGQHKYHNYLNKICLPTAAIPRDSSIAMEIHQMLREMDQANENTHSFACPNARKEFLLDESAKTRASEADEHLLRVEALRSANDKAISQALRLNADDNSGIKVDYYANYYGESFSQCLVGNTWLSYLVGIVFGRWDIRCATGQQAAIQLPDPFAPLPICPPGQLQNAQGLPACAEDVPPAYPVQIPWDGILVDDPNHPLDIDQRVREVIEIIWAGQDSASAQAIEQKACEILGVASLRDYFRKPTGFFADHLKRYSKSRRQAPIYWPLSAGTGSYSAWLYYHRFTQDTLYRLLRDFVEPRIQQAERDQFELESQGAVSGDEAARLQEVQTLLQDLRILKSELDLVAPIWSHNLNDGVIINHAILWRITPYTPWQKKCKECWDKLVKGDYDWAHLAVHLWPERVIPKCTTDRSLAIAHGLEERLWQETNNGNWLPRQLSEADLQALIAEHNNPAVKSALERFLAAPPPVAPTRTRASRSTRSTGSSAPRRPRGTAAVVDAEATRQVLLALTAAPSDGLAKAAIADLIGVEANALTAVIKQLKESGQIDQLGERRGARYVLSEQGRARLDQEEAG